jgi:hypothetical protein
MEAALASGDVDAVRRLLSGGTTAELRVVAPACSSNPLFKGRHWLRLPLADSLAIELLHYRVMGKVVWPAAQALAEDLIEFWRAEPAMPEAAATFVEVAAGAGLPALVAASAGSTFGRVVATDLTEEGVQLLAANDERNGSRLAAPPREGASCSARATSRTTMLRWAASSLQRPPGYAALLMWVLDPVHDCACSLRARPTLSTRTLTRAPPRQRTASRSRGARRGAASRACSTPRRAAPSWAARMRRRTCGPSCRWARKAWPRANINRAVELSYEIQYMDPC